MVQKYFSPVRFQDPNNSNNYEAYIRRAGFNRGVLYIFYEEEVQNAPDHD